MGKTNEKDRILEKLRKNSLSIRGYGAKRLGLFGSFLTGKQNKSSDIDIIVRMEKPTFDNYAGLKFFLEDLLHRKVDLVLAGTIKPALRHVEKEAAYV